MAPETPERFGSDRLPNLFQEFHFGLLRLPVCFNSEPQGSAGKAESGWLTGIVYICINPKCKQIMRLRCGATATCYYADGLGSINVRPARCGWRKPPRRPPRRRVSSRALASCSALRRFSRTRSSPIRSFTASPRCRWARRTPLARRARGESAANPPGYRRLAERPLPGRQGAGIGSDASRCSVDVCG